MSIKKVGDRWLVDTYPAGRVGKRIRKKFKIKSEAVRYLKIIDGQAAQNGDYSPTQKDNRTLLDLVNAWFNFHGSTLKDGKLRNSKLQFLCAEMGNPIARQITSESYLAFRQQRLNNGTSHNTANHDLTYFSAVFSKLIKLKNWHYPNPLTGIQKIKIDESEITYLQTEDIVKLVNYLKADTKLITCICLATGCRWSEAQNLRGEQVNDAKIQFAQTKNSKSRAVPIDKELELKMFSGKTKRGRLFKNSIDDFTRAIKVLNIVLPRGQLTHVLRHSFAVHFMLNRGNILDLQKILGHKTLNQTIRYAQFHPNYLQDALTKNPLAKLDLLTF